MSTFSRRLVRHADGNYYFAKPERPKPPELTAEEVRDLKEQVVDDLAQRLVADYGMPKDRANLLASRQRDRIEVRPGVVGTAVLIKDTRGVFRSATRPETIADIANQVEYQSRQEQERENPPPPPTDAEIRERARRQHAADPMYSI